MRLVNIDNVINDLQTVLDKNPESKDTEQFKTIQRIIRILDVAPTEDAELVVRCASCCVPHNRWTGCPKLGGLIPPEDFYCAYAERKENV